MPTGYTAAIADGITFEQYALDCARAFGALVEMRDLPNSAPIPDKFEVHSYYTAKLDEAVKRLAELQRLGRDACEEAAISQYEKDFKHYEEYLDSKHVLSVQYANMRAAASQYVPPTPEHEGLKSFMIEQIDMSMGDCDTSYYPKPVQKTGGEWLREMVAKETKDITYYTENKIKEEARVHRNNEWVKALRESLK